MYQLGGRKFTLPQLKPGQHLTHSVGSSCSDEQCNGKWLLSLGIGLAIEIPAPQRLQNEHGRWGAGSHGEGDAGGHVNQAAELAPFSQPQDAALAAERPPFSGPTPPKHFPNLSGLCEMA